MVTLNDYLYSGDTMFKILTTLCKNSPILSRW